MAGSRGRWLCTGQWSFVHGQRSVVNAPPLPPPRSSEKTGKKNVFGVRWMGLKSQPHHLGAVACSLPPPGPKGLLPLKGAAPALQG